MKLPAEVIGFLIPATILLGFLAMIWSRKTWVNVILKFVFWLTFLYGAALSFKYLMF